MEFLKENLTIKWG